MNHNFSSVVCPPKLPSMAERFTIDQNFSRKRKESSIQFQAPGSNKLSLRIGNSERRTLLCVNELAIRAHTMEVFYGCRAVAPMRFRPRCDYCSLTTICGAGRLIPTCAVTFCKPAVSASICFCCSASSDSKSFVSCSTFRCSLRNSLSNIAFT